MLIREVMAKGIQTVRPDVTVVEAARLMRDGDFGVMPVCEGNDLRGMLTDRDITVRVVAEGRNVNSCKVSDVMTPDVLTCSEEDNIEKVAQLMADRQVRRLVVTDRDKKLVGIVSIGDLAIVDQDQASEALSGISEQRHDEPGQPTQAH